MIFIVDTVVLGLGWFVFLSYDNIPYMLTLGDQPSQFGCDCPGFSTESPTSGKPFSHRQMGMVGYHTRRENVKVVRNNFLRAYRLFYSL